MMIQEAFDTTTIVACATPPGRGGVGVVRISGPLVPSIALKIAGKLPKPRYATYCSFYNASASLIDKGLILYFPAPHSFTGEEVLELQVHGGPVLIRYLIEEVLSMGAQLAEPGEFSSRAFHNGKIDLVQAEAIADLIDASSKQAVLSASRSLVGAFSQSIQALQSQLTKLRSYVEAAIDFSEEEIDFLTQQACIEQARALTLDLEQLLSKAQKGALLREGIRLVIAGPTNAGKSSLMNTLSQKEVSIVTDIPGTTRDVLHQSILLEGLEGIPVHCVDTAGLRQSLDPIEQLGIQKAWDEIAQADIILLMVDSQAVDGDAQLASWLGACQAKLSTPLPIIVVRNKIDLFEENINIVTQPDRWQNLPCVNISVKTQEGLSQLAEAIKQAMGYERGGGVETEESYFIARARHIQCLRLALEQLKQGLEQFLQSSSHELFAEDLRHSQEHLGKITGQMTADDLLGKIFSTFCVGK